MSDDPGHWILTEGHRTTGPALLLEGLCRRLLERGIPLWRATLSFATLHPQMLGFSLRWWRDRDAIEETQIEHGITETSGYLDSPLVPVIERGETVRYRLEHEAHDRLPLLAELRAEGATDYIGCPLTFLNGWHQVATWASDRPGGFTDAEIATLTGLLPALAVVVEAQAMRRLTANLLDIYLGRTIGRHILNGEVRRRQGEQVRAVLLATDLRGFTNLSDGLPGGELIELLDDYFDAVVSPIHDGGGEVLKFVGDGLLAIFGLEEGSETAVANAALAAAQDGLARLSRLSRTRQDQGRRAIRIGVGLHVGTVIYGNVGAADRLDFTAIGPAVNLVCRLESLTKRTDRTLLASSDFAAVCSRPLVSLGFHPVRGLGEPAEVFGLPQPPEL
ncbi:MAG TPA: adenylate/guanylate cyclase domain-containing protein [Stellaceae bacterium]|nr:adenylate/guanylate cyclase domain-containing protein [Stellaceae bacterium]